MRIAGKLDTAPDLRHDAIQRDSELVHCRTWLFDGCLGGLVGFDAGGGWCGRTKRLVEHRRASNPSFLVVHNAMAFSMWFADQTACLAVERVPRPRFSDGGPAELLCTGTEAKQGRHKLVEQVGVVLRFGHGTAPSQKWCQQQFLTEKRSGSRTVGQPFHRMINTRAKNFRAPSGGRRSSQSGQMDPTGEAMKRG
jgi:hypothetical protein